MAHHKKTMTEETNTPGAALHPHANGPARETTALTARAGLTGRLARILVLPVLLGGGLYATWAGFAHYGLQPMVAAMGAVVVFGFAAITLLEQLLPYRKEWQQGHGDTKVDVLNILVNNGIVEKLLAALLATALAGSPLWLSSHLGFQPWPHFWPLWAQLVLMAVISEFFSYWYHYLAHTTPWMWRFHAIHHSPHRLYLWNAPRFHPVDRVISNLPDMLPFVIVGGDPQLVALYFTYNAITGLIQHCNIDLELGPLHYVFSAGSLHRWHHSKRIAESDNNFGSNLIVWDLVFGTYFRPKDREVGEVGLLNPDYPTSYLGQLAAPFASNDLSKPANYQEG